MRRESLLGKVQAAAAVRTRKPSADLIEGEHGSIHRGRKHLLRRPPLSTRSATTSRTSTGRRPHPSGATAGEAVHRNPPPCWDPRGRHGSVDGGARRAGLRQARDVAVLAAGALGQIVMTHGDSVGLVAGPMPSHVDLGGRSVRRSRRIAYLPPLRGDLHLERVLRTVHDGIDADGEASDVAAPARSHRHPRAAPGHPRRRLG